MNSSHKDMTGREVIIRDHPTRVISLVPSITEFLIDIGVHVVGRTKFCIHPEDQVRDIAIIGGTKNYRLAQIDALRPDLIIGNKEENEKDGILALAENHPVWISDIETLDDMYQMMSMLGALTDKTPAADELISKTKSILNNVKASKSGKVIYFIWQKPYMAAGQGTFINYMLEFIGYENVIKADRYPELNLEEFVEEEIDYVLLSSEPFPFQQKHIAFFQKYFPKSQVEIVDGERYSWYGSRLLTWNQG